MDQDLLVMVARADQVDAKVKEIQERGLEVVGKMGIARVVYVYGDPRKLEGMTGITIRKEKTLGGI